MIGCMKCGKAFTYAKVVEEDATYDALLQRLVLDEHGSPSRIATSIEWAKELLNHFSPGDILVYLDGMYWRVHDAPLKYDGWFAKHDLARVPQLHDDDVKQILRDPRYWFDRERPDRHDDL